MTEESADHTERLAIVGGGAIARGLATVAAAPGRALVCTRTPESADKARDALDEGVEVTCRREDLAECTFVVESIVEDHDAKAEMLRELDALLGPDAVLATTTSSLSVEALAAASGRPDRFVGLQRRRKPAGRVLVGGLGALDGRSRRSTREAATHRKPPPSRAGRWTRRVRPR